MYDKTTIVGNLGRDPEMRYTPQGTPVTQMSVAVTKKFTDGNGQLKEITKWYRVATFGKRAEVCAQYLTKGARVLVEGELVSDENTGGPRVYTRKDGTSGAAFELRANTVLFLSRKTDSEHATAPGNEYVPVANNTVDAADTDFVHGGATENDLPF